MICPPRSALLAAMLVCLPLVSTLAQAQQASVERLAVLPTTRDVEVEIQTTQRIAPETLVVPSPDRLVLDFPGAMPGAQLRALVINRGGVKAVRAGLYRSSPPVTRVVLDLERPVPFQVFPSGRSVIVKLGEMNAETAATDANAGEEAAPQAPPSFVKVRFQNGLMSVQAEGTNLAAVLAEIHKQTGADVAIPAGAEQEPVVASLGPAPAQTVLASLLNGSRYNFVVVGSNTDASLRRLILTPKSGEDVSPPAPTPAAYNYEPPVAPPMRVQSPPSDPSAESMPPDQEIPEQSGDQANDAPIPQGENPPNEGAPPQ